MHYLSCYHILMNRLKFIILAIIFSFFISACQTIKDKTDAIVEKENKNADGEIIHKGISQRQFARSFTIADDVKVNGAELKDGLLTISCERIVPEHKKKKLINIK